MTLEEALKEIEVLQGDLEKKLIYAHPKFVEPMLDYIVYDFQKSRMRFGDYSIGGMAVCEGFDQAKKMFDVFQAKFSNAPQEALLENSFIAAGPQSATKEQLKV